MIDEQTLEHGLAVADIYYEQLNEIIRNTGEIQINNKAIWNDMLHKTNNRDWECWLAVAQELNRQHPEMVTLSEHTVIEETKEILDKYSNQWDMVLTPRKTRREPYNFKRKSWKCMHTLREIWCRCRGVYLPNSDASKKLHEGETLFTIA